MTAGERLAALAKSAGTAQALLVLIGAGATTGELLVNYSSLPSATAATHLLANKPSKMSPVVDFGAGGMPVKHRPQVQSWYNTFADDDHDMEDLLVILCALRSHNG